MSNSSRIEVATRQHVGATLTSEQIVELVKLSNPDWKGGTYPSDAAGKRVEDGTLTHRGKVAYGDLVLELVGSNQYKVLATEQIIRRPSGKKPVATAPAKAVEPAAGKPEQKAEKKVGKGVEKAGKKSAKSASQTPVPTKSKGADRRASV
jgi:hypothetical protein